MSFEGRDAYLKNVLSLAYLGDSVFSLLVREYLVTHDNSKPNALNKKANSVVCAKSQAEFMAIIKDDLKQDELDIVTRARNSHLNSKAKNSTLAEYNLSTQFEALIGYWYLQGKRDKLDDLFERVVKERL